MKSYPFEHNTAWQECRLLIKLIHAHTASFAQAEGAFLAERINASAIDVSSNVIESISRKSSSGQRHYARGATRTLMVVLNLILLAVDMGFITQKDELTLRKQVEIVEDALSVLMKSS